MNFNVLNDGSWLYVASQPMARPTTTQFFPIAYGCAVTPQVILNVALV